MDVYELSLEQALRIKAMELAVDLTLKDEALFAGSTISFANRIYTFINTGAIGTTPIEE